MLYTTSTSPNCSLCVWQINCRSSSSVLETLVLDAGTHNVQILLLQDPPARLRNGHKYQGFTCHVPTVESSKIETAVLISNNLKHHPLESTCGRWIGANIETNQEPLVVISSYVQHSTSVGLLELENFVEQLIRSRQKILIGMDSNSKHPNWGPPQTVPNSMGLKVNSFLSLNGLVPLNKWPCIPTHINAQGTDHWIDITVSNSNLHVLSWEVKSMAGTCTDHNLLQTIIHISASLKGVESKTRNWAKADWPLVQQCFLERAELSIDLEKELATPADLDCLSNSFQESIQAGIDKGVPYKTRTTKSKSWWSEELTQARIIAKGKTQAERRYQTRHGTLAPLSLREEAKKARHNYKDLVKEAKASSWRNLISASESSFWPTVKRITRPFNVINLDYVVDMNESTLTNASDISQALANKFFPTYPTPYTPQQQRLCEDVEGWENQFDSVEFPPIDDIELTRTIRNQRKTSAPGADGISYLVLFNLLGVLLPYLKKMYNSSLRLSHLPPSWKYALVVPIPKVFAHQNRVKNMRPISLLSVLSKVLESILQSRISYWIYRNNILDPRQSGFRPQFSTEKNLLGITSTIHSSLLNESSAIGASLDIASAFDTVWPHMLLLRLQSFNIPKYLFQWVYRFLQKRRASFRIQTKSFEHDLELGVPQGSSLSPTLFILFMEDLFRLPTLKRITAYADDIFCLATGSITQATQGLQEELTEISKWCTESRLSLAFHKCKIIVFEHGTQSVEVSIKLGGITLERVSQVKLLGIWLDSELSFSTHLDKAIFKGMERFLLIRKFAGTTWGFKPSILHQLFKSCVEPCVYYACSVWFPFLSSNMLSKLSKFCRLCLLMCTGCLRTTSYSALYCLTGTLEPKLQLLHQSFRTFMRMASYEHKDSWTQISSRPTTLTSAISRLFRGEALRISRHVGDRSSHLHLDNYITYSVAPWEKMFHVYFVDWNQCGRLIDNCLAIQVTVASFVLPSRGGFAWTLKWGDTHKQGSFGGFGHFDETSLTSLALCYALEATEVVLENACRYATYPLMISSSWPHLGKALLKIKNVAQTIVEAQKLLNSMRGKIVVHFMKDNHTLALHRCKDLAKIAARSHTTWQCQNPPCWSLSKISRAHLDEMIAIMKHDISQSGTGIITQEILQNFVHGVLWSKSLSRKQGTLANQLVAGHFPSKVYLRRFKVQPLVEDTTCICGSIVEDATHLIFSCPLTAEFRRSLTRACNLSSEAELRWHMVGQHPDILGKLCMHVQSLWLATGRTWGPRT